MWPCLCRSLVLARDREGSLRLRLGVLGFLARLQLLQQRFLNLRLVLPDLFLPLLFSCGILPGHPRSLFHCLLQGLPCHWILRGLGVSCFLCRRSLLAKCTYDSGHVPTFDSRLLHLQVSAPCAEHGLEAFFYGHCHHYFLLSFKRLSPLSKNVFRSLEGLALCQAFFPHELQLLGHELHHRMIVSVCIVPGRPIVPINVAILESEVRILLQEKINHLWVRIADRSRLQVQVVVLHRRNTLAPLQPPGSLLEKPHLVEHSHPRYDIKLRNPPEV
mmetsp:Transcript_120088/g.285285  ORF Transcript_120088/g.285285 Transcript_120088/m.285285 type:complete len:274 (+) Transcript_120088:261-1082(+)